MLMAEYKKVHPESAKWFFDNYARLRESSIRKERFKQLLYGAAIIAPLTTFGLAAWYDVTIAWPAAIVALGISGISFLGLINLKDK